MNPHELANDLAAVPFLEGMNDRHINILASCACRMHFEKDTIVFHQGETANRFYLITEGTIELEAVPESGARIGAGTISRGGVLGWSWLFPPYEWQFTARALTQTYTLFFYGTVLREHCETDPSLGFELFKRMGREMVARLQSARRRLVESEAAGFSRAVRGHAITSGA
jgi:CRP-like cAMP-binding protein